MTFLHFFLESPSLLPGERTNPAENSAGPFLIPPASPGNGRSGSRRTAAFRKSSCQSQSSRTRLICIASERHDETNLLDKVNAVGTLCIRDGDHEQLVFVRPGKDAGVAQLLAVVVEDDAHAAVVEILVSAVQRAAALDHLCAACGVKGELQRTAVCRQRLVHLGLGHLAAVDVAAGKRPDRVAHVRRVCLRKLPQRVFLFQHSCRRGRIHRDGRRGQHRCRKRGQKCRAECKRSDTFHKTFPPCAIFGAHILSGSSILFSAPAADSLTRFAPKLRSIDPAHRETRRMNLPSCIEKSESPLYFSTIAQMLRTPMPCPSAWVTGRPFSNCIPSGQGLTNCKKRCPFFSRAVTSMYAGPFSAFILRQARSAFSSALESSTQRSVSATEISCGI